MAEEASKPSSGSERPNGPIRSLRETVREALLHVLSDAGASAAAKASAGRTLMEYFEEGEEAAGRGRRGPELSLGELDAEIARESARLTKGS
jgi:hypothetical protein